MNIHNDPVKRFVNAWRKLAAGGMCDELEGAESQRVFQQWLREKCLPDVREFIIDRANRPPYLGQHYDDNAE
jgi:hypothetical protein